MASNHALVHDLERTGGEWKSLLESGGNLPVLDRAYRAVVVLLLTSGLRGLAGVKTAEVASLANINESTLFRYVDRKDQLVADSVDWCWKRVNEHVATVHHRSPAVGLSATDVIMIDLDAFLGMYDTPETRLYGTGALLSFRRAEHLVGDFEPVEQLLFRERLKHLCRSLISECNTAERDPETLSTFLINYLATVWFTWLADADSKGPEGLLNRGMVTHYLRSTLDSFSACEFSRGMTQNT